MGLPRRPAMFLSAVLRMRPQPDQAAYNKPADRQKDSAFAPVAVLVRKNRHPPADGSQSHPDHKYA